MDPVDRGGEPVHGPTVDTRTAWLGDWPELVSTTTWVVKGRCGSCAGDWRRAAQLGKGAAVRGGERRGRATSLEGHAAAALGEGVCASLDSIGRLVGETRARSTASKGGLARAEAVGWGMDGQGGWRSNDDWHWGRGRGKGGGEVGTCLLASPSGGAASSEKQGVLLLGWVEDLPWLWLGNHFGEWREVRWVA